MKVSLFEATHQGARQNNQDSYLHVIADNWSLFIVADGLGGVPQGEVAAAEFCQACATCAPSFAQKMQTRPLATMPEFIQHAAKLMCTQIHEKHGVLNTQTVFALAWLTEKSVITAHVGDARIYRLNSHKIWRTPDHTLVQQLFDQHIITEEDFADHPLQNRLLKALNTNETPVPEVFLQPLLNPSETLLLCSDGFWTRLSQADLQSISQSPNVAATIQHKISEILTEFSANSDNITVQSVRII